MKNTRYKFTFEINVNSLDKVINGYFYALDIDDVYNKLPKAILRYVCYKLAIFIRDIKVFEKHEEIAHFTSWEDLIHQSTIA